jgi:hypothetical protein
MAGRCGKSAIGLTRGEFLGKLCRTANLSVAGTLLCGSASGPFFTGSHVAPGPPLVANEVHDPLEFARQRSVHLIRSSLPSSHAANKRGMEIQPPGYTYVKTSDQGCQIQGSNIGSRFFTPHNTPRLLQSDRAEPRSRNTSRSTKYADCLSKHLSIRAMSLCSTGDCAFPTPKRRFAPPVESEGS